MSLIVDEHREYLADAVRLSAFARALREVVAPGASVVDLGSGTGILGLLACAAGASRVYAIERTGISEIARALVAANGMSDRMRVVHAESSEAVLPERVDVIVGDFIGRFGFDAGIFEMYPAAAERFLKPGGTLIPSDIAIFVAPVESGAVDARVRFWTTPQHGLDLSPAMRWATNMGYPVLFDAAALLGRPEEVARAATSTRPAVGFKSRIEQVVQRQGILHGLAGWCSARMSPGVTLTNSPLAPERVGKRNVFLPIGEAIPVVPGDRILTRIAILPNELVVTWTVEVRSSAGTVRYHSAHSTLKGMLLDRGDLLRMDPDFVPALTGRGLARLTVLELADGSRALRDIERTVFERHRALFPSADAASAFVAEVITRYARP